MMVKRFVPAPNTAQVSLIYTCLSQTVENVLHYLGGAPWTPTSLSALCAALANWESTQMAAIRHNSTGLARIEAVDLSSRFASAVEYTTGLPITGTGTGAPCPNNVTVAVGKRSALRGRSFRGRIYHIGMQNTLVAGNELTSAAVVALQTRYDLLRDVAAAINTSHLAIVSRVTDGADRPGDAVVTPVTRITLDNTVDSQRRRLEGRGR